MTDDTALLSVDLPFYGVEMTPTALTLPPDLSFEDWTGVGEFLFWSKERKETELDTINWMIGDWLRYGEHKWGERYAQAVMETGLAYQTLANVQWTTGKFSDPSRRRENLTFTHHAAVAALPEADADELLNEAEERDWSSYTIREHAQDRTAENDGQDPAAARAHRALGHAADAVARLDADWAEVVVNGLVRPLCRACDLKANGDAAAFLAELALKMERTK